MPFKNPAGLYALLALIPFIILYLRRPKPKEKTIPSLMFFMKEGGATKFSNFFKQFLQNLIFLLQLAIIVSAALAVAAPFFTSEKAASAKHTVVVIDGSASMNAMLSGESQARFEKAVEEASSRIEGRASIILAANIPVVVLEKTSSAEAKKVLATLKAKATETHVGDAMLAAGELIADDAKSSKVIVLSDFQSNSGTDVIVAKRSLSAMGANVELINVLGNDKNSLNALSNVGFVELDVNKFQTTALVKNYDDVQRAIDIEILNGNKVVSEQHLTIGPRSLEGVSFETIHGSTQLNIQQDDDIDVDNHLFISSPAKRIRALVITNSDTSYIVAALKSSPNVELDVAFPPVVKSFNYDAIIIHNASSQFMLPGFYKEINKALANGAGLVITAQDSLPTYVKQFNMPLQIEGTGNASKAEVKVENYLTKGVDLVDFGVVATYSILRQKDSKSKDFTTLVAADDGSPLLGTYAAGSGIAMYYGFLDDKSTFRSSYSYPIFWDNLMSFITKSEDLASFNVLTGRVEGISEQQAATPSGKLATSRLFFDDAGFYTFGGKTVAANLLNKGESDIKSPKAFGIAEDDSKLLVPELSAKAEVALERKLMLAALALLLLELLLIKTRGDL
ncbi:BatA domain-containing protein [Candidatus Woesearchaeota archaeon]|nr:BatA domain-containing protein [Candidatus Woesearchaeota archaeon]